MRVLAISDEPAPRFYEYYRDGVLADYDLILSCGDLKRNYLEFLVTMARCPLLYVHGNHDESFDTRPPEGCICVDGQVYVYKGVRILGLGGSHKYRDGSHLYTQSQMDKRLRKLWLPLKKAGGVDILLTHAPAAGLGDLDSLAHQGFRTFNTILDRYHPAYLVHGHIHPNYGVDVPRRTVYGDTTILNAYGFAEFEI